MTGPVPLGGVPDQIGILVPDIDAAMRRMTAAAGLEPWMITTMSASRARVWDYRGAPGTFRMTAALSGAAPQLELLQPLDGPSIYHDWIAEHGWGVQHFGYFVDDLAACIETMRGHGFAVIQEGRGYGADGDGGYAYFDSHDRLGVVTEAIERPRTRRPPDRWWPAPPDPTPEAHP